MSSSLQALSRSATLGSTFKSGALRILLHVGAVVIAVGCFMAYQHFKAVGPSGAATGSLIGCALFGFIPLRDLAHLIFGIEGKALHLVHAVGALALIGYPVSRFVPGTAVLSRAAMAPFAIMAAAQAVMHQDHPRNAKQAAAMRTFASSLPEVAAFASAKDLTSPENAQRAIAALTDIISKAEALGQTELDADPNFQSALSQATSRFGGNMGLDAVDLALRKLEENPSTASAVPELRKQLAAARKTLDAGSRH